MSLIDSDPNTTNRLEPTPQAPDQNPVRQSDGTTAITNKQDASSGPYVSTRNGAVKVNNGTDMIGLFGPDSTGETVIKIAKPGYDASTAADDQLVFNSAQNTFKIVDSGSTSITILAFDTFEQVTIPHSLGYAPQIVAYIFYNTGYVPLPLTDLQNSGASAGLTRRLINASVSTTDVTVTCYTPPFAANNLQSVDATYTIKYYLLQETAN